MAAKKGIPGGVAAFTMGPISTAVKRRATPQQWRRLVNEAHKRGFAVESFLDRSVPDDLKQRTRKSLQTEATKTISSAYAPAELELNQTERRVKALDEKRRLDNERFSQWLTGRTNELQTNAAAAQQRTRDEQARIASELANELGTMSFGQPAQGPNASGPGQTQDLRPEAARGNELVANARSQTESLISSNTARAATDAASNIAFAAAQEAKRTAETWSALAEVGDDRQKLVLTKAADSAKEVARLIDNERTKSSANRDTAILSQRLGLDSAKFDQSVKEADRRYGLDTAALAERTTNNQATQNTNRARLGLAEERLTLDWWKAKHPAKGKGAKGGTGAKAKDPQSRFEMAYADIANGSRPSGDGKSEVPLNSKQSEKWIKENTTTLVNQLVKQGYSRELAQRAIRAFVKRRGADPGSFKDWILVGPPKPGA